jgi:hypothetical protein
MTIFAPPPGEHRQHERDALPCPAVAAALEQRLALLADGGAGADALENPVVATGVDERIDELATVLREESVVRILRKLPPALLGVAASDAMDDICVVGDRELPPGLPRAHA